MYNFNHWMTDPLRLCFTINNFPELFRLSMTLAMNTTTGRIPPWRFYVLRIHKADFCSWSHEKQWITQAANPNYLAKVRTRSLVYFCIGQQWKQLDLEQKRVRRPLFSNFGMFSSYLVIMISAILTTKSVTLAPKDNCCFKARQYSWQLWEDSQLDLDSSFHLVLSAKIYFPYNKSLWSNY